MGKAFINPNILAWAREKAGLTQNELAHGASVQESTIDLWEQGTDQPTFSQARTLAKILKIPFGGFWLSEPCPDLIFKSDREAHDVEIRFYITKSELQALMNHSQEGESCIDVAERLLMNLVKNTAQ